MDTILPDFNKANFKPGAPIDNPYFPVEPGSVLSYSATTEDGEVESNDVFATFETRKIAGVKATVTRDTEYLDGAIVEDTFDWYAQDKSGNVWYLGELSFNYEYNDEVEVDTDGSWEAGIVADPELHPDVEASPGFIMPSPENLAAFLESGDGYFQEFAPGVAVDEAKVDSLDQTVSIGLGDFEDVLRTFETTALEPDVADFKYYAPGLGQIRAEELDVAQDLAVDLTVDLVGTRDLNEAACNNPGQPEIEDFIGTGSNMYVTVIGADGDHSIGAYSFSKKLDIEDGAILFSSTDEASDSATASIEVAKKSGLGLFIIPDGGGLDEFGIDLSQFEDGGLTFTNPTTFKQASLDDGVAPMVSAGALSFEAPVSLPDFAGEEEVLPLPLQIFHSLDPHPDGINLLNPAGGVQAVELQSQNADDEMELTLLGFEDKRVTDPEFDGDYNDVVLAISATPLDAALVDELATEHGFADDPLVG